jgi:hypothetical protein
VLARPPWRKKTARVSAWRFRVCSVLLLRAPIDSLRLRPEKAKEMEEVKAGAVHVCGFAQQREQRDALYRMAPRRRNRRRQRRTARG